MELEKDYLASKWVMKSKLFDGYSKMFFKTYENLVDVYNKVDFKDKDVLSVLASSDQVFTAYLYGAKKVDSFDVNILTKYYYYLRIWTIKYMRQVYPTQILDNNYKWLNELLDKVTPRNQEEQEVLEFWKKHAKEETKLEKLFFDDYRHIEGKTEFNNGFLGSIIDKQVGFKNIDFYKDIETEDKYDIILMSNIIEWARDYDDKLIIVRDNLTKLLRNNGVVLCTDFTNNRYYELLKEKRIFDHNFSFLDYGNDIGYVYTKK